MYLTDEKDTTKYPMATLENANIPTERLLYSGLDSGRVNKSTVPGYPADGTTSPNDYIQQLSGSGFKIGSGIMLKVMTGDQVAIKVSSWYKKNGAMPNTPNDLAASLVANLINSLTGAGGPVHGAITSTQLQSSGVIPLSTTDFLNNRTAPGSTKPKAYLNWVLLDEQFKFVSNGSGAEQVGNDQEFKVHTPTSNISKSGYLYVFVSNETPNINVFFDNLQVTHLKGPLLEESHYYPFGTEMSAISNHSLPSYVPNRYKANAGAEYGDEEWSNGSGLEMYETFYRSYNAQIGRFMQGDPMMEVTLSMSGYVFSGNNPVMFTDLFGDLSTAELYGIINHLFDTEHGGQWSASDPGRIYVFGDEESGSAFGRMAAMGNPFDFGSEGRESGNNGVWSSSGGFYDKGLYPEDAKWVRLNEVVVMGNFQPGWRKNGEPYQYVGGSVQNWTNDKGNKKAIWSSDKGEVIEFVNVTITNFLVERGTGYTTSNGAIHADNSFRLARLQHEYGHYLQAIMYGSVVYNTVIIPNSLSSMIFSQGNHDNFWTEKDANAWATLWFGKNSAIGKDESLPKEFSYLFSRILNSN